MYKIKSFRFIEIKIRVLIRFTSDNPRSILKSKTFYT